METQTMKAGRELDALVELKVMGFVWDEARCRICGWPLYERIDHGCTQESCCLRPAPARRADEPPPYSTELPAAWLVFAKLPAHERTITLFSGRERQIWRVFFGLERGQHGEANAETAPLAICLAAIQAVGS